MQLFKDNKTLVIIAIIAVVNALGYGIIIPILYSYSLKFGLSDFQNGLLFALFSVCQFLSTPIIGRLSDKFGRRPLLLLSLLGTALSFLTMAFAPSAAFLFLARALDGITAGNIPVASAVISDTTAPKDRAKGFGIIGASFGFGFIFGPAISAFTVSYSPSAPFLIAAGIALLATILTALFLPETNAHMGQVPSGELFHFKKMAAAVTEQNVGPTLLITLFYAFAFSMFIYAFQPFSIKILHLTAHEISLLFTIFGVIGLFAQLFIVPNMTKLLGLKKSYSLSIGVTSLAFLAYFFIRSLPLFIAASVVMGLFSNVINPLTQTILSRETDEKSQGSIQGLNASYMSVGQIIGPIVGGIIASFMIPGPFLFGSLCILTCFFLSRKVLHPATKKESAF